MKAVFKYDDDSGDYGIKDYMDIHPSSAIFTGNKSECEDFISRVESMKREETLMDIEEIESYCGN